MPSPVTVTATVESGVDITLSGQSPPLTGPTVALASQHVADGTSVLRAELTTDTDLSVNFTYGDGDGDGDGNAYAASCATPGGEVVVRVKTATATKSGAGNAGRAWPSPARPTPRRSCSSASRRSSSVRCS